MAGLCESASYRGKRRNKKAFWINNVTSKQIKWVCKAFEWHQDLSWRSCLNLSWNNSFWKHAQFRHLFLWVTIHQGFSCRKEYKSLNSPAKFIPGAAYSTAIISFLIIIRFVSQIIHGFFLRTTASNPLRKNVTNLPAFSVKSNMISIGMDFGAISNPKDWLETNAFLSLNCAEQWTSIVNFYHSFL